jgi:MSHA biogenesis protein MshQ
MNIRSIVFAALSAMGALAFVSSSSQATTITGTMAFDNQFIAYLSTDPNILGTQIGSGTDWGIPSTVNGTLSGNQTYYLEIVGTNAGLYGGFVGQFNLSDTGFQFSNGTQTLLTNTTNWTGNLSTGTWTQPTGSVLSQGANGDPSNKVWYGNLGGPEAGIDNNAPWIWPNDAYTDQVYGACQVCTVNFETAITANPVPLHSTGTMIIPGLLWLGWMAYRRKNSPPRFA